MAWRGEGIPAGQGWAGLGEGISAGQDHEIRCGCVGVFYLYVLFHVLCFFVHLLLVCTCPVCACYSLLFYFHVGSQFLNYL